MDNYSEYVGMFKALSDVNRIMIVDMLSCGELCACKILEKFNFTQPTLSHHMKMLCDCGLTKSRREGKWTYYSLNEVVVDNFKKFICSMTTNKEDGIDKGGTCNGEK
nr:metalloregulator ArsR/SmtB family transcription factor [Anaerosporobacter sp.]